MSPEWNGPFLHGPLAPAGSLVDDRASVHLSKEAVAEATGLVGASALSQSLILDARVSRARCSLPLSPHLDNSTYLFSFVKDK